MTQQHRVRGRHECAAYGRSNELSLSDLERDGSDDERHSAERARDVHVQRRRRARWLGRRGGGRRLGRRLWGRRRLDDRRAVLRRSWHFDRVAVRVFRAALRARRRATAQRRFGRRLGRRDDIAWERTRRRRLDDWRLGRWLGRRGAGVGVAVDRASRAARAVLRLGGEHHAVVRVVVHAVRCVLGHVREPELALGNGTQTRRRDRRDVALGFRRTGLERVHVLLEELVHGLALGLRAVLGDNDRRAVDSRRRKRSKHCKCRDRGSRALHGAFDVVEMGR